MSNSPQKRTQSGLTPVIQPAGSGLERRTIDPDLKDDRGERIAPQTISVSNGFALASINNDPNLPNFGTFDVQNRLTLAASCLWEASALHSIQKPVDQTQEPTFGPNGGAVIAPLSYAGGGGGGGEVNTASNLGGGDGLFASKVGVDLQFKSLTAGPNVTLTPSPTEILIDAVGGGGEVNTASNLGAGDGLFASKVGVDLQFKSLTAGPNVTLTPSPTEILIDAVGGGGGADIRPNRITIGNADNGDTTALCDYVWDNANLVSMQQIKDMIEATVVPPFEYEFFFRQGTYSIPSSLCPIQIPTNKKVSGAGMRNTLFLVGEDSLLEGFFRWDTFQVGIGGNNAEIRDLGIVLGNGGANPFSPIDGLSVVSVSASSTARNVRVSTSGAPAANDTNTTAIFRTEFGGNNARILDCVVDCDIQKTNIFGPVTGIPAFYNGGNDTICRMHVELCDHGFILGGFRSVVDMTIQNARTVGACLGGGDHLINVQANINNSLADSSNVLDIRASGIRVEGSIRSIAPLTFSKNGITLGVNGTTANRCRISCQLIGWTGSIFSDPAAACEDLHVENSVIETSPTFPGTAIDLIGNVRAKLIGNSIQAESIGVSLGDSTTFSVVSGNTIIGTANAITGISVNNATDKNTITSNTISLTNPASVGIDFIAGSGLNQVAANNAIKANTAIQNPTAFTSNNA